MPKGDLPRPALSYRGVTLKDFQGTFDVAGRMIRMKAAKFRAAGGRGEAEGAVDFTALASLAFRPGVRLRASPCSP